MFQGQSLPSHVIEYSAWSAHHNVYAPAQRDELAGDIRASINGKDLQIPDLGRHLLQFAGDLYRKFPCGSQDQSLHSSSCFCDALDHGDAVGSGLSRASLGQADCIVPPKDHGDRLLLYGSGFLEPHLIQAFHYRFFYAEFGKIHMSHFLYLSIFCLLADHPRRRANEQIILPWFPRRRNNFLRYFRLAKINSA